MEKRGVTKTKPGCNRGKRSDEAFLTTSIVSEKALNIYEILDRLEDVRQSGNSYIARCPLHDDRSPSLSIAIGDDGRILLHCFTGCEVKNICEAIGLTVGDLFPDRRKLTPKARRELSDAQKRIRAQNQFAARRREAFVAMVEYRDLTQELFDHYGLDCPNEILEAVHFLPLLNYYLKILASGTNEELLDLLRKGVIRKWSALYNSQKKINS